MQLRTVEFCVLRADRTWDTAVRTYTQDKFANLKFDWGFLVWAKAKLELELVEACEAGGPCVFVGPLYRLGPVEEVPDLPDFLKKAEPP